MEIIEDNLHPKVLKNRLFINAIDYLIEKKIVEDQKGVSAQTGITESTLSNIRNDKKIVSDKTIRKFLENFPGIFNPDYFKGQNIYMTLKDAIDAKIYEEEQKQKERELSMPTTYDISLLIEKAVEKATAYADKAIAALEDQVEEKNARIKMLEARIHELEAFTTVIRTDDPLRNYPFEVGVSESKESPRAKL